MLNDDQRRGLRAGISPRGLRDTAALLASRDRRSGSRELHELCELLTTVLQRAGADRIELKTYPWGPGHRYFTWTGDRQPFPEEAELWLVGADGAEELICCTADDPSCAAGALRSTDPAGERFEVVDVGSGGLGAASAGRRLDKRVAFARGPAGPAAVIAALEDHSAAGILLGPAASGQRPHEAALLGAPSWYGGRRPFAFRLTAAQEARLAAALVASSAVQVRVRVNATLPAADLPVVCGALGGSDLGDEQVVLFADVGAGEPPVAVAAALQALGSIARAVVDGQIPPLRRSLQLVIGPGVYATTAWLADEARTARRARAALQLSFADQPAHGARQHDPPPWLPSFIGDIVAHQLEVTAAGLTERVDHAAPGKLAACVDRDVALPAVWIVAGAPRSGADLAAVGDVAGGLAAALVDLCSLGPEDLPRLINALHTSGTQRLAQRAAAVARRVHAALARGDNGARRRHLLWLVEQSLGEALRVERERLRSAADYLDGPGSEALRVVSATSDLEQTAAALSRSLCAEIASAGKVGARLVARRSPPSALERRAAAVIPQRLVVGPAPPLALLPELSAADRRWLADNEAALAGQPGAEELLAWADGERSLQALHDLLRLRCADVDLRTVWRTLELLERAGLVALRVLSRVSAVEGAASEN